MKSIIIALFTLALTFFAPVSTKAQTVTNMSLSVTRNALPGQAVWHGSVPNSSFNTKKEYVVYSTYFNWNHNGSDIFNVYGFGGIPVDFWLRATPGRPNPRFNIRVVTPGVTVHFNGFILSYNGVSTISVPMGTPFNGYVTFDSNTTQFQQVIFSASRD